VILAHRSDSVERAVPSALRWRGLFRSLALSAAVALLACGAAKKPAEWTTLDGCRFVAEGYSDGDSFHVRHGDDEFIFRLYFVDAPELDDSFPDRNAEQAAYFRVSREELKQAGEQAKAFVADALRQPFTVTTRWQNALGRSALPRFYALVEVNGDDLGAMLIRAGLARAKGTLAVLPDGTRAKDRMAQLLLLEKQARQERRGLWAKSRDL
jgi:endonuclease YncB( thermonuclease family)